MPIHQNGATKKRYRDDKKPAHQITPTNQQRSSLSLTDLPSNVLVEILARLPLRTLFIARSVCKTFGFLTTANPHFTNLHSSNATHIPVFQQWSSPLIHVADNVLNYKKSHLRPFFQFHKIGDTSRPSLVNSCNGLLYFRQIAPHNSLSLVCNPVTSEYIIIHDPLVDPKMRIYPQPQSFCLGFSPVANQYKLLRIFIRRRDDDDYDEVAAQVYVIGSDSWRDIDDTLPLRRHFFWNLCQTEHVNGVMYWHYGGLWPGAIISFDFEREKFGEVALPSKQNHNTNIGVLGGCLCFSFNNSDANCVDLWVMRKCGNQDSWTKDFVFYTGPVCGKFRPLQFLGNGEILMHWTLRHINRRGNTLVCYDPRTVTLRPFVFDRAIEDYKVMVLTPSFVPLKDTLKVENVLSGLRPR